MKKRAFLSAIFILIITPVISSGNTFTGVIDTGYRRLMLLSHEGGVYTVLLPEGLPMSKTLIEGDVIKVSSNKQTAGVWIAQDLEVLNNSESEITTQELFELISLGKDYLLIDARPIHEYRIGHIPGAISLYSLEGKDLKEKLSRLIQDREKTLIFYTGPQRFEELKEVVEGLRTSGYKALRTYSGGTIKWVKDGYYLITTLEYIKAGLKEGRSFVFVDTRPPEVVREGHIPQAINILFEELMPPMIMPYDGADPIVFYGEDINDRRPHRIALMASNWGYHLRSNSPVMVLEEGFKGWLSAGLPVKKGDVERSVKALPESLNSLGIILSEEFKEKWARRHGAKDFVFLDVRSEEEFRVIGFKDVLHIPVEELHLRLSEIPKDREIIIYCSRGVRAKIAYYILKQNGYRVRYLNKRPEISDGG